MLNAGLTIAMDRRREVEIDPPKRTELIVAMREIVRLAIMTLEALPDRETRYMRLAALPVHVIHSFEDHGAYRSMRLRRFQPTPAHIAQMEVVMPWLSWLRQTYGNRDLKRLWAYAMGTPLWRLGERERCSDKTVLRRIDASISAIIKKFAGVHLPVEHITEPYKGVTHAIVFEPPNSTSDGNVRPMKIYVGGRGFFRTAGDGKPARWLDNGRRKFRETAGDS